MAFDICCQKSVLMFDMNILFEFAIYILISIVTQISVSLMHFNVFEYFSVKSLHIFSDLS